MDSNTGVTEDCATIVCNTTPGAVRRIPPSRVLLQQQLQDGAVAGDDRFHKRRVGRQRM
jgi:hypothetical protein